MLMKTAKLLSNGNSQSVILPEEIHFGGTEVFIRKSGETVMIYPKDKALDIFFEGVSEFTDDYFEAMDSRPVDIISEREQL